MNTDTLLYSIWTPTFHAHCCPHKDALLTSLCSDTPLWDCPTWVPQVHAPSTLLGLQPAAVTACLHVHPPPSHAPASSHQTPSCADTLLSLCGHTGHSFPAPMSFSPCLGLDTLLHCPFSRLLPLRRGLWYPMLDFSLMWTPSSSHLGSSTLAGQPQPLRKPPRSSTLAPTLVPGSCCSLLSPPVWTFSATYLDLDVLLHLHGEVDLAQSCLMAFGIKHSGKEGKGK